MPSFLEMEIFCTLPIRELPLIAIATIRRGSFDLQLYSYRFFLGLLDEGSIGLTSLLRKDALSVRDGNVCRHV